MNSLPDALLVGRTIASKFIVESFLGGGAMGAVYRARQVALDKPVAIKVLRSTLAGDPTFAARFHREAKAASRLDHPNSIRILDYGEEPDGLCYIAMELLDGKSLHRVLAEQGPLPSERIVSIVSQVLAALAVAHDAGVLHRDLKPENILVAAGTDDEGHPADHVKVCDFGIAKLMTDRGRDSDQMAAAPLATEHPTQEGLIVGTPEYMSPEQGKGEPLDARSDLYAVGVVLYQMLTGVVPFDSTSPIGTVMKHLTEDPKPPSSVYAHGSPALEAICLRALKKDREERYQSAREMRGDLRTVYGVSAPLVLPPARAGYDTLRGLGRANPRSNPLLPPAGPSSPSFPARHGLVAPPITPSTPSTRTTRNTSRVDGVAAFAPRATYESEAPGTLALLAGSVLPPPRRRGSSWAWLSLGLLLATGAATAVVVSRNANAPHAEPLAATTDPKPSTSASSAVTSLGAGVPGIAAPSQSAAPPAPSARAHGLAAAPTAAEAVASSKPGALAAIGSPVAVAAAGRGASATSTKDQERRSGRHRTGGRTAAGQADDVTADEPAVALPASPAASGAEAASPAVLGASEPLPAQAAQAALEGEPKGATVPTATAPAIAPAAPDVSSSAKVGHVTFGKATSSGLDDASIRKLVQSARGRAQRCYEDAVQAGATDAHGRGTVAIETDGKGAVDKVSLSGIDLPAVTVFCITDAFQGTLKPTPGGEADARRAVSVPVVFAVEGGK